MKRRTDPRPKTSAQAARSFRWPVRDSIACRTVYQPESRSFADVFEGRRSTREMTRLTLDEIVNTVAYVCLPRFRKESDPTLRTQRPSLSAGALHPISVVVVSGDRNIRASRYEPFTHALQSLDARLDDLIALSRGARLVLPDADGTWLAFLAEPHRTDQFYEAGESLLWRDAGALMQSIALAATSFGQAFCPLGILGSELVDALSAKSELTACGLATIGRPLV